MENINMVDWALTHVKCYQELIGKYQSFIGDKE